MKEYITTRKLTGSGKVFVFNLKALFRTIGVADVRRDITTAMLSKLAVKLERANVTGVSDVPRGTSGDYYYTLDSANKVMTVNLANLPSGTNVLSVSAKIGTNEPSVIRIILIVKDGATGTDASETFDFDSQDIVVRNWDGLIEGLTGRVTDLENEMEVVTGDIGTMSSLTTTDKTSLVNAANEINGKVGNLASLATTDKSSVVAAINEVSQSAGPQNEVVTVAVSSLSEYPAFVLSGLSMVVRYNIGTGEVTQTLTTDAQGHASITLPIGAEYRVEPQVVSGFVSKTTQWFTAVKSTRTVNIYYTAVSTGFFIIDDQDRIVPWEGWNVEDNPHALFVMYYDSQNASNPIIYPKTLGVGGGVFCLENIDCPLVENRVSAAVAEADFGGKAQSDAWRQWATTPDAVTGKTPVEAYNEAHSTSATTTDYIKAVMYCYNATLQYKGETIHGFLPAMGQLRKLCDNRTTATTVHTLIGGSVFPNLASGDWWSCSERNANSCWFLSNGATGNLNKTNSPSVFPLYDLSLNL